MKNKSSRRSFIKKTALAGAAFTIVPRFVLGRGYIAPSDKITFGLIGCGRQRGVATNFISHTIEGEILACSDLFSAKMEEFKKDVFKRYEKHRPESGGRTIDTYLNYEELLERDDIDAVVVATPDHWHAIQSIKALRKGKDLYCEKPLTLTIKDGRAMVEAARQNNRVVQTGSMQRSWNTFRHACELVRNGYVGDIKKVLVNVGDPAIPYDLPAEEIPNGFDWDKWCGPSPLGNYNAFLAPPQNTGLKFWPKWRDYREYAGGILSDWGAHMFDIAQWGLGTDDTGPVKFIPPTDKSAVRGLKMIYKSGIEMVHEDFGRGWGVRFIGTEGELDISRSYLDTKPEKIASAEIKTGEIQFKNLDGNHNQDFVDAIKSRSKPICDVEIGHRSASICNLANIAYEMGDTLKWNPKKEKFKGNKNANAKLNRKKRGTYTY